MNNLFEYLEKEWDTISQAPLTFIVLSFLTFTLAYFAAKWRFLGVIEKSKATNETLNERLIFKSDQIEFYKERALKFDNKVQEIVEADTDSLKEKTLDFVKKIREFIEKHQREDSRITYQPISNQKPEDWEKRTSEMIRMSEERNLEYERRFKVDAILLRDELRSRLPDYKTSQNHTDMIYEHPTNFFGFNDVAADLERMAKHIKKK